MLTYTQFKLTKTSRLLVGFCIVVFGVWFIAAQFTQAAKQGKDAVKQIEIRELEKAVILYNISRNEYPEKLGDSEWCEVGARYGDRRCLYELTRDGYLGTLPVSPDESPYYYRHDQTGVYLAASIEYALNTSKQQTCDVKGIDMWCIEIRL